MASYRVTGMSTAQVKELQSALGVKADGAWGKQSQAALERAYGAGADARSVYTSGGGSSAYGRTGGFSGGGTARAGVTDTYGKGEYGGKYLGSDNNTAYSNMDNPPGSAGYETGVRINVRTGAQTPGVLPLGTRFTATGGALADARGVPESSGIFAFARGRTPGYVEHVSGYKGMGYVDAKGNYYDAQGNYLREDGYFYQPGAQVSRNGMYQNTGGGMGSAQHRITGTPADPLTGTPANLMYERAGIYGSAPGRFMGFFGGGEDFPESAYAQEDPGVSAPPPHTRPPAEEDQGPDAYQAMFERELRRYLQALSSGYGG